MGEFGRNGREEDARCKRTMKLDWMVSLHSGLFFAGEVEFIYEDLRARVILVICKLCICGKTR
jgi:hypothetical protein